MKPLNIIQNPAGTYHFVGQVPVQLGWVHLDGSPIERGNLIDEQLVLPSKYRSIKTRVFKTHQDAYNAATDLGFEVAVPF